MKNKIVFASGNRHKLEEVKAILSEYEIVLCSDLGFNEEIEETGATFYENALIKAKRVSEVLGVPALSDDSGLCVEALSGAPGIFSARYAGDGKDESNIKLLLKNMEGVNNRNAEFVSAVVYYDAKKDKTLYYIGKTEGRIRTEKDGYKGFGYDPVFYSFDLGKSMGVATAEEKNSVSHRARALNGLKELLKKEKI